jgi:hypothetical protein
MNIELWTTAQAANVLRVSPRTLKNYVRAGRITAIRRTATSPLLFEPVDVARLLGGNVKALRSLQFAEDHVAKMTATGNDGVLFDELNRRCMDIAKISADGAETVRAGLRKYGVAKLGDLHPKDYLSFRGHLCWLVSPLSKRKAKS